jgi:hypothetical protein
MMVCRGPISMIPLMEQSEVKATEYKFLSFIQCFKHLDGARDMFWIKSLGGTFKALQNKKIGPKNV